MSLALRAGHMRGQRKFYANNVVAGLRLMRTIQLFIFLTAVISRIAAEIYEAKSYFLAGKTQLPQRYRNRSFYLICLLGAVFAGALALFLARDSVIAAFAIGATLPTMLKTPTAVEKFLKIGR